MDTQIEEKIAQEIMVIVDKLQLPFMLDSITEGKGNCFPLAILAQCRRPEVFQDLSSEIQSIVRQNNSTLLRLAVRKFMLGMKHKAIIDFRRQYEDVVANIDGRDWLQYWDIMVSNNEWVDYTFVQSTAWLLQRDIVIIPTSGTQKNPYFTISGNIANGADQCPFPPLTLGCKSNSHYQSLLPKQERIKINTPANILSKETEFITEKRRAFSYAEVVKQGTAFEKNTSDVKKRTCKEYSPSLETTLELKEQHGKPLKKSWIKQWQENQISNTDTKSKTPYAEFPLVDTNCKLKVPSRGKKANSKEGKDNQTGNDEGHMIWKYTLGNLKIDVRIIAQDQIVCPFCYNTFKKICNHFKRSKCKIPNLEHFSQALREFKTKTFMDQIKKIRLKEGPNQMLSKEPLMKRK